MFFFKYRQVVCSEDAQQAAANTETPVTAATPRPLPTADCVFTSHELLEVCELSRRGNVPALSGYIEQILSQRCCRIGPRTFCPDEDSPSAFIVAAQNGRLEVLKYLLSCQPVGFIVNHRANATFYHRGQCHVCPPLYAACRCGYSDAAKELIAAGATVDHPCKCCGESPLYVAASNGFLAVVKLLLSHGASLNKAHQKTQWTPLFAATASGHTAVVRELLQSGADGYQPVQSGHYVTHWYSAIQVAAISGNEAMVNAFMCQGLSPIKSLSSHNEHTPNPLFMAAALGYRDLVATLLTHPDCSPDIRLDALKILGPPWLDSAPGLESPCTSFGLSSTGSLNILNVYAVTQYLQEYVGGYGGRGLLDHLFKSGKLSFESRQYSDAETFWVRAMELASVYTSAKFSSRALVHRLDFDKHVCIALYDMTAVNYTPLFSRYVEFFLGMLSWSHFHRDLHVVLDAALLLMATWLHHDVVLQTKGSRSNYDGYIGSEECERYGQLIVQRYLHVDLHVHPLDTMDREKSILWYVIALVTRPTFVHQKIQIKAVISNQSMFFDALLRWGADTVINEPQDSKTPLHVLATTIPDLIPTFLAHGAHLDVVDGLGKTPYEQTAVLPEALEQLAPTAPLPLVCLACRAIVQHSIPYGMATSVPPRMVNIIKLHDPRLLLSRFAV